MTTNKIKELIKMFTFLSRFSKLLKQWLEKKKDDHKLALFQNLARPETLLEKILSTRW